MKNIFSNSSEVIHLFANKTQERATNQTRNAYFNSDGLFSYGSHYQLAKHLQGGAILINDLGYSMTTTKHINEISQASRHKTRFYTSSVLIGEVLPTIENLLTKLPKAKSRKLEYIATIKSLFDSFQRFQRYAKENKINKLFWSNNNILQPITDKRSKEYKRLLFIAKNMQNLDILESEVLKEKARQDKKEATKQKQQTKAFREGKSNFVRLKYDLLDLRYDETSNKDLTQQNKDYKLLCAYILTSQNVKIKFNDAKELLSVMTLNKYDSIRLNSILKNYKIGYHTINKVQDKKLFIGCHTIQFKEVQRIAKELKKLNYLTK